MAVLRFRRCGLAVITSFLLAACSGGMEFPGPDGSDPAAPVSLSGSVGDGPVVNAVIRITDAQGTLLEERASDDLAGYQLTLPAGTKLPVLLEASGGTDLVTGRELDFMLLGAALETGVSTVNLSPLTTLAVRAAQCSGRELTAAGLEEAWQHVHASLGMGLDANLVPDPMGMSVTRDNIEAVVLANEALGETVRRTVQALAAAGTPVSGDDVLAQMACDLTDGADSASTGVELRVAAAFKAAELAVRLETLAGRLEVDGSSATDRMNDAIRLVMRNFSNPSVDRVPVNPEARKQALELVSLFQEMADSEALLTLAAALDRVTPGAVRDYMDAGLTATLQGDLYALTTNVALADDTVLTQFGDRRSERKRVSAPLLSLSADPGEVAAGEPVSLSWASSSNVERCVSSWGGAVAAEGVAVSSPLHTSTVFSLFCVGPGGTATDTAAVVVGNTPMPEPEPQPEPQPAPQPEPLPVVTLSAANEVVSAGGSTTLNWSSEHATTCLASGGWTGLKAVSGSGSVGPLSADTTYHLACAGAGGTVSRSVTVQVEASSPDPQPALPAPTLSLQASPSVVVSGGSVQLTWTSGNATSCSASGGWAGSKATSGSQTVGSLTSGRTFTLTCSGMGGSVTRSASVQVQAPAPTPTPTPDPSVSLNASASVVDSGDRVQLTWNSSDADTCTAGLGWSGSKPTSGSQWTNLLSSRTSFRLTCSRGGVNASTTVSVSVNGAVVLAWQAPTQNVDGSPLTDLASYKVYYGTVSRDYDQSVTVPAGATSTSVKLPSGSYYFAMTALDADGNESAYSNEVLKTVN